VVLMASLLVGGPPVRAADRLEVRLDGLSLPIDLDQLESWSRNPVGSGTELGVWFELLDPRSRRDLISLLRTPLLPDRSLALQLLQSWAGRQVLDEVAQLLDTQDRRGGLVLLRTFRELLQRPEPVTILDVLRAVPAEQLRLDLDGLLALAQRWRGQLQFQAQALSGLRRLPLPELPWDEQATGSAADLPPPRSLSLAAPHRSEGLALRLWAAPPPGRRGSWVLLMPGLGGSGAQLAWLAEGLARRGWAVLVLEHPGSDDKAVRQLLDGQRLPPGAETIPDRLADVQTVLEAERAGRLPPLGDSVVLIGHSLGGLTALLAAGARPEPGLARRCERALDVLPLLNLSHLLQCQIAEVALPPPADRGDLPRLAGVVSLNGFGSLLWPARGLERMPVPVLHVGGGLDLITPPVSEQLGLFLQQADPRSRLALVDGGSHFSVVRISGEERPVLRLGDDLVGVEPLRAQTLLLGLTADFLASLEPPARANALPPQRLLRDGVRAYVLDRSFARRWRARLRG
jgi:predicted dienelactone hydrolase